MLEIKTEVKTKGSLLWSVVCLVADCMGINVEKAQAIVSLIKLVVGTVISTGAILYLGFGKILPWPIVLGFLSIILLIELIIGYFNVRWLMRNW